MSALKPMKQIRVMASTPPASASGTSPEAISSAARPRAAPPELQARTTVSLGPVVP